MKYRVKHMTRYSYGKGVDLASHLLHLRPRPLPFQIVRETALMPVPSPVRISEGHDHFGNRVTWLFMEQHHDSFAVTAESLVDVAFPKAPAAASTLPWEQVVADAQAGGVNAEASEFLFSSPMCATDPGARAYVAHSFPAQRPVMEGVLDLLDRMAKDFTFRAGVTTLATPIAKVLASRQGVCQDFSHLMISGLRGVGLPARYVSGYIRTRPPPGQLRRRGSDQSHAWVSVWMGAEHGWLDVDPTNRLVVKDEHVVLGWGRDFGDVSPMRGVILGGGAHTLEVTVDLEPIEA
jgi:transglutaminase-like putative cysteine protease